MYHILFRLNKFHMDFYIDYMCLNYLNKNLLYNYHIYLLTLSKYYNLNYIQSIDKYLNNIHHCNLNIYNYHSLLIYNFVYIEDNFLN